MESKYVSLLWRSDTNTIEIFKKKFNPTYNATDITIEIEVFSVHTQLQSVTDDEAQKHGFSEFRQECLSNHKSVYRLSQLYTDSGQQFLKWLRNNKTSFPEDSQISMETNFY